MNKNYKSLFTSLILEAKKEMEQEDSDIKDKDYKNQEQSKYSKNIKLKETCSGSIKKLGRESFNKELYFYLCIKK